MSVIATHWREQFDLAVEAGDWAEASRWKQIADSHAPRPTGTPAEWAELADLHWSTNEIAKRYGVSRETVATTLARQERKDAAA